eukprot:scaffold203079_cov17-Tisochrysis_lutea.AAC.2
MTLGNTHKRFQLGELSLQAGRQILISCHGVMGMPSWWCRVIRRYIQEQHTTVHVPAKAGKKAFPGSILGTGHVLLSERAF